MRGVGTAAARRPHFGGANLLRTLAVLAVLYSHISYYLIDDLGTGWWMIDTVYEVFVKGLRLHQHLSFLGVAVFMVLTGLLLTASVSGNHPGRFLVNRVGRLLPALWVAVALAVLLVKVGINGMFSGHDGITTGQAALSFVLGGFFLKPEVAVLGVTWTLVVQITFYVYSVATRPLLRRAPAAVPILGAALCCAVLIYNQYIPQPYSVPMLTKVAATLPAVFVGQVIYMAWTRMASWRWLAVAALAQVEVVLLATDIRAYWAGDRYLWTIVVVASAVLALARYDGPIARWSVVRWTGTRSYAIYLLHTLILYRAYDWTVGLVGKTGAVVVFLAATAVASELLYRAVEVPAGRWIGSVAARVGAPKADPGGAARPGSGAVRDGSEVAERA
ncbi:acyltransferase family protein [Rhodococcus sp. NPDC058532]|uniref:acyltransferase family protein n=1 Tax=Rhodococcus sp. NPDC058532 TaxID=3346540 RepID=UPI003658EF12